MIDTAEKHNDPGKFTAFIGYEWTSMPSATEPAPQRAHFLEDGKETRPPRILPLLRPGDSDDPEELWTWMEAYEEKTGGRAPGHRPQRQPEQRADVSLRSTRKRASP